MLNKIPELKKIFENKNSVFNVLSKSEKVLLQANSNLRQYRKGDIIFREGEEPKGLFILIHGKVKIYKKGVGKREQILKLLNSSGLFGYRAFLAGEKYVATARAMEESSVAIIEKGIINQICDHNHRFSMKLIKILASDSGSSYNRIVSLTQKHIRGRIAESLLYLIDLYGFESDNKTLNSILSRSDLAGLSNMTTSNAIRTLSAFANEGVVTIEKKKIRIIDLQKLIHISSLGW